MDATLKTAIEAIKAGDTAKGGRLLTRTLDNDPDNVTAWFWVAHLVEDPQKKRQALQTILQLEPDNERAQEWLAKLDNASPQLEVWPESYEDKRVRTAQRFLQQGDRAAAYYWLQKALAYNEANVEAWYLMARTQTSLREQKRCYRKALDLDPDYAPARAAFNQLNRYDLDNLSVEHRSVLLEHEIRPYINVGWQVISKTDTSAQLKRPRHLDSAACCLFGVLYLLYRAGQSEEVRYVEVGPDGTIKWY